jgi:2,5-diamino-6-(ribosylamino)-4(3H)-pyrimidinone 5'-phosphate reductase
VSDRPRVVVHVAVSLDGATTGFEPDVERFYELARTWDEDVTLAGADTILAQEDALAAAPRPGPAAGAPVLAVVDGRRRVTRWDALRECGHWSDVVPLRARVPGGRVDLAAALGRLGRQGEAMVRVDSGGELTGALLRHGLVDELSLLVHPVLAGSAKRWYGPDPPPRLRLRSAPTQWLGDGLAWLRYSVAA